MEPNLLIQSFYEAFQKGDSQAMGDLYHEEAVFQDPVFGRLNAQEVKTMWTMLVERSRGKLTIHYHNIVTNGDTGSCQWEAWYPFGSASRPVHNKIKASFEFRDGKIYRHTDRFSFWRWSAMALGMPGLLLGFTPLIRNKVRKKTLDLLEKHRQNH